MEIISHKSIGRRVHLKEQKGMHFFFIKPKIYNFQTIRYTVDQCSASLEPHDAQAREI
jgi:hypothetical protein